MTDIQRGLVALIVTLAAAPLVLVLLRRRQVLDVPTERSSHLTPVPRGGGIAPGLGALVALAFMPSLGGSSRSAIALAAGMFGLSGLLGDVGEVRALRRLSIQFVVGAIASLLVLDGLTGPILWRGVVFAGVILWLVAFVNAFNFMDGIDGISVAQALGAGATWFIVGTNADSAILAGGGAIVAGAALGFAPFNLPHARMFLGDVGSYFIGAWLASVAVLGLRAGVPPEAVLAPLALYLADTATTLGRRVARGERWYLPHRNHAYQRLGDAGWSHLQASALVAACIGVCGALGAVSLGGSIPLRVAADVAIAGVVVGYLVLPRWLARRRSTLAVV